MPRPSLRRIRQRAARIASWVCILSLFGSAALSVGLTVAVHQTSRSEFCNSCHIMEPYFESWQHSSHADVSCVECHYDPGTLETLEGKFGALTQLAKYVTRTAGTKPWAEVSDASCMRSGCHSIPDLDGSVAFGTVRFDHRPHLLESREGKRLRCVTCHSQVELSKHFSVSPDVCASCHFKPARGGEVPAGLDACSSCHRAPTDTIEVAGLPFQHDEYVDRSVSCRECHQQVSAGDGLVREERCRACHTDRSLLARIEDAAFLHEEHVRKRKVECSDCHDQIRHGLLPLETVRAGSKEGCGSCHDDPHTAAQSLYTGTGAAGIPDSPSRMFQTRVGCTACHTGRSGRVSRGEAGATPSRGGDPIHTRNHASIAAAGNVDCIHCHGTGFDGMLAEWQAAVGEHLDELGPRIEDLAGRSSSSSDPEVRRATEEARLNYRLVALDGSRGAHNVVYALDALRASAERIDSANTLLGFPVEPSAAAGLPFRSADGCSACHAAVGRPASIAPEERAFPHARHVEAGLDCSTCHSVERHGQPAFARDQCGSCHHQEAPGRDLEDCAGCHADQARMLRGTVAGAEPGLGAMSSMECTECHGEAPDVLRPSPASCVLCHAAGYDQKFLDWASEIEQLETEVAAALAAQATKQVAPDVRVRAQAALDAVRRDGSRGAHHFELAKSILEDALRSLGAR